MKRCFLVITVAFLFLLTGCSLQKKKNVPKKMIVTPGVISSGKLIIAHTDLKKSHKRDTAAFKKSESLFQVIKCVEARLSDIPSPLAVKSIAASDDGHGCYTLVYQTSLSFAECKKFYLQEMERAGWHKGACFESEEFLCSFKKNSSSCILSVRPATTRWALSYPATIHISVQR